MDAQKEAALFRLQPFLTEAAGVSVFAYPGTREELVDNLVSRSAGDCLPHFVLRFQGALIDLDLLFYLADVIRTKDGVVIFYSPESRMLDMKIIQRP